MPSARQAKPSARQAACSSELGVWAQPKGESRGTAPPQSGSIAKRLVDGTSTAVHQRMANATTRSDPRSTAIAAGALAAGARAGELTLEIGRFLRRPSDNRLLELGGRLRSASMSAKDTQSNPEREQTDEKLRAEREKADDAIGEGPSAIDETADAVIEKARSRADSVLSAARAKSDRQPGAQEPLNAVSAARLREDQAVLQEREEADEALRGERAERVALLAAERKETDEGLSRERARSDSTVSTRDEFLGIVSHDLRNMLSGMVGFAGLIARDVSPIRAPRRSSATPGASSAPAHE